MDGNLQIVADASSRPGFAELFVNGDAGMPIMRKKILGQVIFLAAALSVGAIVFALNAFPAEFAGRERATFGLAVAIACLGATAHFVGVTFRLAVVAVGIAAVAFAYYFLGHGLTPPWGLLARL